MGEQFSADLDRLRALAPGFDRIGAEVKAAVEALRAVVGDEAAPWGDDDTGKAFGKSFVPEQHQALSDLDSLVQVLQQAGGDLRQLADNFEHQDFAGGRQIRDAGLGTGNSSTRFPGGDGAVPDQTDPNVMTTPIAAQPSADATARTQPAATAASTPFAAALPTSLPPGTAPTSDPAAIGTPDGVPATERRPGQQEGNRSDPNRPGTGTGGGTGGGGASGTSLNPAHRADAQRTPPVQENAPTATPSAGASGRPGMAAAAKDVAASTAEPWSKSAADRPPRVAVPGSGASDSPPRMPGRPAARPPRKADKPDRKPARPTVDAVESVAARLARELSERHSVQAFGFDTFGVPDEVLAEIAAAVHDILPRYPDIDVRAIGIDDLPDGELTRLEWDSAPEPTTSVDVSAADDASVMIVEPTDRVLFTARIVLAARAATDPNYLEQTAVADSAGPLALGYLRRPVYSSIVRELGGALDVAGGFRARTAARRALITAYLPGLDPEDRGSLNRTVAGFREWRSQLSGHSFRGGRFEPAAALAEGFTETAMNGGQAAPPARVLHRLLVETAREHSWRAARHGFPGSM
ncbi:hypothetical protein [Nocardia sp. NPDC051463]|uniref:hypothetical protein n=1 Tax=Nocardia sp. NPDC051463 TaxID=3154845 RepID=UPI00344CE7C1